MPRPDKHNADYFSHDSGMRNDPKIKALRKRFKNGYSVYNMLLEFLTETDFFEVEINELNLELMAGDFDVEAEILDEIISYCVKIKLLLLENGKIYSFGLKKRLKPVIDKRNNAKDKFLSQKLEKESVSAKENTQSKVKYSKVKESKDIVVEVVTREEETSKTEIVEILEEVPLKNENILDEEKYSAIADYLENQTMFCTIQSQQKITENEVLEHFRFFYEQKVALKELKDQTQDEILRNFYFWVPIHLRTTGKKIIKLTPANDQGKGAAAALEMFELLKK